MLDFILRSSPRALTPGRFTFKVNPSNSLPSVSGKGVLASGGLDKWLITAEMSFNVKGCDFQACTIPMASRCGWHREQLLTSVHNCTWSQVPSGASSLTLLPTDRSVSFSAPLTSRHIPGPLCAGHFFPILPLARSFSITQSPLQGHLHRAAALIPLIEWSRRKHPLPSTLFISL